MKKQKSWLRITLIVFLMLLAFGAGYFGQNLMGTAFAVQEQTSPEEMSELYSWTFALCTKEGRCMDVHAECNGTQVLKIVSVTEIGGHDDDWQDPRGGNPSVCPWINLNENKS